MNFDDTARFLGPSEKLWPELFAPPSKTPTILCRDCRKTEVAARRRYRAKCAHRRKLVSTRECLRTKRHLNVRKTGNSLVRAEALTSAKSANRYGDTAGHVFLTDESGGQ
jgi:hypothetical protein